MSDQKIKDWLATPLPNGLIDFYKRQAVYVLALDTSRACKIGLSVNPSRRCAEIQTSQDCTVSVYWAARFTGKEGAAVEREVHAYLKRTESHKRGEWYWLSPEVAKAAVERAAIRLRIAYCPDPRFGFSDNGMAR